MNPPSILKKILAKKVMEIGTLKSRQPLSELHSIIADLPPPRAFSHALIEQTAQKKTAVIAEIKKASPSKGLIRENFDIKEITMAYTNANACCLSVLTDKTFFQGDPKYIRQIKKISPLPILRKDFIIDSYQIYESRALGADCILLIAAVLSDEQMKAFTNLAQTLGMDVLVEIHNREELERGMMLRTPLIGINNRNLHTFKTNLRTTINLLRDVLQDRTIVTESGIKDHEDILLMQQHNVYAFLVGETLMRAKDPGAELKKLINDD